ncbi:MAG: hypothetical protein JO269_09800 [Burkholderiaceae bacterium]|nr:hypothetical protein [Burkholderiaceae bacterium]
MNIDIQALRKAADNASPMPWDATIYFEDSRAFREIATPTAILEMLDMLDALKAENMEFAKWIERRSDTFLPDFACQRCAPHSDMLKEGFICVKHRAIDVARKERRRDER